MTEGWTMLGPRVASGLAVALLVSGCGGTSGTAGDDGTVERPVAPEAAADPMDPDTADVATEGDAPSVDESSSASAPPTATGDEGPSEHTGPEEPAAQSGTTAPPDRVITVTMTEFAFTPDVIDVAVGETVQFVFTNPGMIEHEAVLGDHHVQEEHRDAMRAGGGDHHGDDVGHHGAVPSVTVATGEVGTFVHTFTEPGELLLGCHLPGHWDAGMVGTVRVS